MKAFDKVLSIIKGGTLNGHAVANAKNIKTLSKAKKEIEEMMR